MLRKFITAIILLTAISLSAFADGGKIETTGAFAGAGASESVKKAVEEKGYRVTLPDGSVICEIWLRKALPTQEKTDISGAIYTEIPDSAVLAVVSFPKLVTDFRGQDVKAGAYTLRYVLHPTDGNHMGISPYRDFLLLTPVANDQNVDTPYKFEDLVILSAKTTGTKHPAMWSLVAAEAKSAAPTLSENEHGHLVFTAKIKNAKGVALPIALVVKGMAEQ